jgi:DNA-binding response OmpR family regulator
MHQRHYHILVAQDDAASLNTTVSLLKRRRYTVAGAATVDDAQWWLSGWPVDLVIASSRFDATTGVRLMIGARENQPEMAGLIIGSEPNDALASEARQNGLHTLAEPVDSEQLLARVAELLAGITRRPRWPRKDITRAVPMHVGQSRGRLMDVSYGGLKFELADAPSVLHSPIELDFPRADVRVHADVVWSARRAHDRAVFGASVMAEPSRAAEWRAFVDRL